MTHCTIAVVHEDGSVSQVYCHSNGDLDDAGVLLTQHYTDRATVEKLISGGDITVLGKTPELCDYSTTKNRLRVLCVFTSFAEYISTSPALDVNYLFTDHWQYSRNFSTDFISVSLALGSSKFISSCSIN